jgi:hypothetical protein
MTLRAVIAGATGLIGSNLAEPSKGTLNLRSAKELYRVGATGLEPVTPSVSSRHGNVSVRHRKTI